MEVVMTAAVINDKTVNNVFTLHPKPNNDFFEETAGHKTGAIVSW